uniref:Uncharacterized LOC108245303 n=1 Tax=Kryptolebias marmoratus TaxID=37003 RepID=A0A3Q3ANB9_KRYMA
MKRMTRVPRLARLWALLVIQTGFGLSAAVFVERQEGDSVLLPCDMAPGSPPPYGFYLKRGWLRPGEVLFQYTKEALSVKDSAYGGRLSVSGDPSAHSVNVTISQLRAADTDRYFCEFMLEKEASEDERIPGKTEFFLLVNSGDRCGCSSYDTLLYALSGAVGLLLVLLVGFIVKFKVKVRRSANSQPPQPIYEEMVGVQSPSQKMAPLRLEDVDYKHVAMKRSSSENHYERPSGALYPRTLAQE